MNVPASKPAQPASKTTRLAALARRARRIGLVALIVFASVLRGTTAAAGGPSQDGLGRQPSDSKPAQSAPAYARDWLRASQVPSLAQMLGFAPPALAPLTAGFPRPWWALANGLTPEQGSWLVNGLGVAVVLIGIAVGVQKLRGDKEADRKAIIQQTIAAVTAALSDKHEMHLGGQPIAGTVVHPCVEHPTFDKHVDEIWKVTNGLRLAIARIETVCGENKVLREANADRLIEVASKQDQMNDKLQQLVGGLEANGMLPKKHKG